MLNSITGEENSAFMKEEQMHLVENQLLNAIEDDDTGKLVSLNIHATETPTLRDYNDNTKIKYFLFIKSDESITMNSEIEFIKNLNCYKTNKIHVLSIFGKIGDGKSHTLNNIIFNGEEIFQTSSEQESCTKGVHVAYNNDLNLLCFDTEGMPDSSGNENKKTRLLWKILAVSDIIIFRTRSEKLQDDMFLFLGNASKAYNDHFRKNLDYKDQNSTSKGPVVIIFHETINTSILSQTPEETAEEKINKIFQEKKLNLSAFRSLKYLGVQTKFPPTDYKILKDQIHYELEFLNNLNSTQRTIEHFFNSFRKLNNKFYNEINFVCPPYSTKILECNIGCEICNERCRKSLNHEGEAHYSPNSCTFDSKFENHIKLCKTCYDNGCESITTTNYHNTSGDQEPDGPSLSWISSFTFNFYDPIIYCRNCGDISPKSNWFSAKQSLDNVVETKVVHVWPGGDILKKPPTHPGQKVIDGITSIRETVTNYATEPTKFVSTWVINKVNPSYWRNDEEIINCQACRKNFNFIGLSKHHCRKCGEGFCDSCTKNRAPVPEYGFRSPARVCNKCYKSLIGEKTDNCLSANGTDTMVRRYSEAVVSALKPAGWVYEQSLNYIKHKIKPEYWVSDGDSPNCSICFLIFGNEQQLQNTNQSNHEKNRPDVGRHHCRKCGKAVCNNCSKHRFRIPELGWNYDVRVCDECFKNIKHKNE